MDLTACPECDLVQREPARLVASNVLCRRCGAVLYRAVPHMLDSALALTLGAAILFVIANIFPVMTLESQGRYVSATLTGVARALHDEGMTAVGILVFATLVLMPALEILARLHLLLPLRFGRIPKGMAFASQLIVSMRSWSMVEVFVLAAVVSMHRLSQVANLSLEPGIWAIGAVMLLTAATDSIFDSRALWSHAARRMA